jgi:hypothetical protein
LPFEAHINNKCTSRDHPNASQQRELSSRNRANLKAAHS